MADTATTSSVATLKQNQPDWGAICPSRWYGLVGKLLFDHVVLMLTSPLWLPLMAVIALANWCAFRDHRMIFFVQNRTGHLGRVFRMIKFRTMWDVSEASFDSWRSGTDDVRVTRLGRLLRNSHLDELPQVLNVLRGNMSVIGPRPEMPAIEMWAEREVPGFARRLALKPGITGYAQTSQGYTGMDAKAYAEKLRLDDHYRSQLSLWLDCKTLVRTGLWMLKRKGWRWQDQQAANAEGTGDDE